MSFEENKAIIRKFVDIVFSKQNWDRLDELVAPDYIDPDSPHLGEREGLKQIISMSFKAMPDWHETIEDISVERNTVWVLLNCSGMNTGEFMGIPPSGKNVAITAVDIYRITDGKLFGVGASRLPIYRFSSN